jgi:hypothetical protein
MRLRCRSARATVFSRSSTRTQRRAFVLRHVEGLPVREIARMTGQDESAVEREIEQARQYLRQQLVEAGLVDASQEDADVSMFGTRVDVDLPKGFRGALERRVSERSPQR